MILARDGSSASTTGSRAFFPTSACTAKRDHVSPSPWRTVSGLPAWRPFYQTHRGDRKGGRVNFMASFGAKEFAYEEISIARSSRPPPATKAIYSDLGFIALGEMIEKLALVALNRFCREKIFRPLGLRATDYIDISLVRSRRLEPVADMFAPTEVCPSRKRLLVGEVDGRERVLRWAESPATPACSRRCGEGRSNRARN